MTPSSFFPVLVGCRSRNCILARFVQQYLRPLLRMILMSPSFWTFSSNYLLASPLFLESEIFPIFRSILVVEKVHRDFHQYWCSWWTFRQKMLLTRDIVHQKFVMNCKWCIFRWKLNLSNGFRHWSKCVDNRIVWPQSWSGTKAYLPKSVRYGAKRKAFSFLSWQYFSVQRFRVYEIYPFLGF